MTKMAETKPLPSPASWLEGFSAYRPRTYPTSVNIRLDANEGVPPPRLLSEFPGLDVKDIQRYPDATKLEALIANRFALSADQVLATCGGDGAIDRVCRAFLEPGRNIIVPTPTFSMIPRYARMTGAEVRTIPWQDDFPGQRVLDCADSNTAVIAVVSPNNPTGATVSGRTLRQLAAQLPRALILFDQAYAEFENPEDEDLTQIAVQELKNAVVVRTFSKAWGMAGLRLGYALGQESWIECLRCAGSPYPVSGVALHLAMRAWQQCPQGVPDCVTQSLKLRRKLEAVLRELGCRVSRSAGNFVLARFADTDSAKFVFDGLFQLGIAVRHLDSIPDALRITCPTEADTFDQLITALLTILQPEAILLDMDGVIADESSTYREAIRRTCESFGVAVSPAEIDRRKLEPNSNNDWWATYHILRDQGMDCTFEEVQQTFERILNGNDDTAGLWKYERLLVDPEWLRQLGERFPLAIVTGRPRQDAWRTLRHNALEKVFSAVICLEDAKPKPSPAPVRLALEQLGVQRAWMLGDTPDDMQAAQTAGALPIGVMRHKCSTTSASLDRAGATRILRSTGDLKALLDSISARTESDSK